MTTERKAKWIAGTLTALLALAITSGVYFYSNANSYRSEAERVRLSQDSLLAVKQLLDKEIADMRVDLEKSKGMNAAFDRQLREAETALNEKQLRIDKLAASNAGMNSLRNELTALRAERNALDLQVKSLTAENTSLRGENTRLGNTIALLQNEKTALENRLLAADHSANRAGNFKVDMLRSNGKVTARAKRTRTIKVSFDLPANNAVQTSGTRELYLVVLDPEGKSVSDKNSKSVTLENGAAINPVKTTTVDMSKNPQAVNMEVNLEEKTKTKGIYTVQVFMKDGIIGSSRVTMN